MKENFTSLIKVIDRIKQRMNSTEAESLDDMLAKEMGASTLRQEIKAVRN